MRVCGEYEVPALVEPDTWIVDSAVLRRAPGETPEFVPGGRDRRVRASVTRSA